MSIKLVISQTSAHTARPRIQASVSHDMLVYSPSFRWILTFTYLQRDEMASALRWLTLLKTVIHPSTNRAQCRVTTLIRSCQTTPNRQISLDSECEYFYFTWDFLYHFTPDLKATHWRTATCWPCHLDQWPSHVLTMSPWPMTISPLNMSKCSNLHVKSGLCSLHSFLPTSCSSPGIDRQTDRQTKRSVQCTMWPPRRITA